MCGGDGWAGLDVRCMGPGGGGRGAGLTAGGVAAWPVRLTLVGGEELSRGIASLIAEH